MNTLLKFVSLDRIHIALLVLGVALAMVATGADARAADSESCEATLARAERKKVKRARRCARQLANDPAYDFESCIASVARKYDRAVRGLPCRPQLGRMIEDWGKVDHLRANADVNGDGLADYCRFVGDGALMLSCQLRQPDGFFGDDYGFNSKRGIDRGHEDLPATLSDVSGDGRADYCRYVGPASSPFVACALATDFGFAEHDDAMPRPISDWGYASRPHANVDVNGDGTLDYCRFVGDNARPFLACQLKRISGGYGHDYAYVSPSPIRSGTDDSSAHFTDVNQDGRADFCQATKLGFPPDRPVTWIDVRECYLAGPEGFSLNPVSESIDECATGDHDCSSNAVCANTADSWECTCREGYVGDGTRCDPAPTIPCNGDSKLCDRRFDDVAFATTHNSFSTLPYASSPLPYAIPNQQSGIKEQLDGGIRAFMLDVHPDLLGPALCHGEGPTACLGYHITLDEGLAEIRDFLDKQRYEVVTIIFESYVSPWSIVDAFDRLGLTKYAHEQSTDLSQPWPTLRQMIESNKRLVVMAAKGHQESPPAWFHDAWWFGWETDYELNVFELTWGTAHCNPSPHRQHRGNVTKPLMTLNHFVGAPMPVTAWKVNESSWIIERIEKCMGQGRVPNFVAVDFWESGDVVNAVHRINRTYLRRIVPPPVGSR